MPFPETPVAGQHYSDQGQTWTFDGEVWDKIDPAFLTVSGLALNVVDKGTVTEGTVTFDWNDGTRQAVEVDGNVTFAYANLPPDGSGDLEIHVIYASGSVAFDDTIYWKPGDGTATTIFGDLGITLTPGVRYRHYVQMVGGQRHGEWR